MPPRRPAVLQGRHVHRSIRIAPEEWRLVERAARRARLPPSTWLRELALAHLDNPRPRQLPRWLPEK